MSDFSSSKFFIFSMFLIVGAAFIMQNYTVKNNLDTRSKAADAIKPKVSAFSDITNIQQQVDSAPNGAVIQIPAGTYSGQNATPIGLGPGIAVSSSRGGADTCFLRIEGKNITLKGAGMNNTILFGEGHSKPYQNPYQNRAGLCIINGGVTVEGLKIKEFQKRCAVVYNSTVVVKNSQVEGCDEGGVSLLGNSSGLFVNNYFFSMNFGGIMLWQNSQAKVINNTFIYDQILFFFHPGTNDQASAFIDNNIFYNGWVAQVDWWASEKAGLDRSTYGYNVIWKENNGTCGDLEYCQNFPGKSWADPLFTAPVVEPCCGNAAWSDLTLKPGSPAIGSGNPSIPGPRNIGFTGGPCADPNSGSCSSFIASNQPQIYNPPPPTNPPAQPTTQPTNPPAGPTTSANQPTATPGQPYYPPDHPGPTSDLYPNPTFVWPTSSPDGTHPSPTGGYIAPTFSYVGGNNGQPNNNNNNQGYNRPSPTYYLPPTIATGGNNQSGTNNLQPTTYNSQPILITTQPGVYITVIPTRAQTTKNPPILDLGKKINEAGNSVVNSINNFFTSLLYFSQLIMP